MAMISDAALQRAMRAQKAATMIDPGPRGGGRLIAMVRPIPSGALIEFYARQIADGRRRLTKLGTYPSMSLAQAREAFRDLTGAIRHGENVKVAALARRRERQQLGTLLDLCEGYATSLEEAGRRSGAEVRRSLISWRRSACKVLGGYRPACDITPADVAEWLRPHFQTSPVAAKQARAWLSAAYTWGLRREHDYSAEQSVRWGLTGNPAILVSASNAAQRGHSRHLSPEEFSKVWQWLAADGGRSDIRACNALRVIMATGQRVEEITGLRAGQVADGWLRWDRTKTGPAHSIPLPKQAAAIFAGMLPNLHGLWFPGQKHRDQPFHSHTFGWICHRAADQIGIPRFSPRDLRRTWRTLAGDLGGLNAEECARLMNHAYGSKVERDHYDRGENAVIKKAGMGKWEAALERLLTPK